MLPVFGLSLLGALCLSVTLRAATSAERATISLDGTWRIEESKSGDELPAAFTHTAPVPGLANQAKPAFKNVDAFYSREQLANRIRAKLSPADWLATYWKGKVDQDRDFFWYQKQFQAPARRAVALLKINKAQFGAAVWLNDHKLGEYAGCFSASYYHLENALRWNEENTLVIRVGAHPAVLPDNYPTGSDFEKIKWTPGIYDSVSLIFCDNPLIETIQVAPRLARSEESSPIKSMRNSWGHEIATQVRRPATGHEILVQTKLRNCGATAISVPLAHTVKTWKGGKKVTAAEPQTIALAPGEEKTVTQTIPIPNARLWSPEDPFLYVVESSTGGDSVKTRFGMREFRFDAATGRAYLNGKIYYLRGSNITLHRFFEDPLCQDLPWNEKWCAQAPGRGAQANALELFPVLHRPRAGPLAGNL